MNNTRTFKETGKNEVLLIDNELEINITPKLLESILKYDWKITSIEYDEDEVNCIYVRTTYDSIGFYEDMDLFIEKFRKNPKSNYKVPVKISPLGQKYL